MPSRAHRRSVSAHAPSTILRGVSSAPLPCHVGHIVRMRPEKQMVGANTAGVVAAVADMHRLGNWANVQFVAIAIGPNNLARCREPKPPAPVSVELAVPVPALVPALDESPKPLGFGSSFSGRPNTALRKGHLQAAYRPAMSAGDLRQRLAGAQFSSGQINRRGRPVSISGIARPEPLHRAAPAVASTPAEMNRLVELAQSLIESKYQAG